MKVLLDTNIILDIGLKRMPYYNFSASVFKLIEMELIYGFITATSITDIYYIINKQSSHNDSIEFISELIKIVEVLPTNLSIINIALNSDFKDFEDAIQSISAEINEIDYIITRNTKDFTNSNVKAIEPQSLILNFH